MAIARIPSYYLMFVATCGGIVACSGAGSTPTEGSSSTSQSAIRGDEAGEKACQLSRALQRAALGLGDGTDGALGQMSSGELDDAVAKGKNAFSDRTLEGLGGNGRACADCHSLADNFQLTPASAKARYDALQACKTVHPDADDPLFRPVDADDFRVNGVAAHDFTQLTENGLIRVTLALPSNIKLFDPVAKRPLPDTTVDLWRAVPPIRDVRITGPDGLHPFAFRPPNLTGGYQHDARFGTLQEQAFGALTAHAQVTNPVPEDFLDNLAAFENTVFTNDRVEALADALAAGTASLPSTDGPLTDLEAQGRTVFVRSCGQCHGNNDSHPSLSTPIQQIFTTTIANELGRYHNTDDGCPRPAGFGFAPCSASLSQTVRTYQVTNPVTGGKVLFTESDPGRMTITGYGPDNKLLDVPSLFGVSKTAPYFINNSAATLDDVLDHYNSLFIEIATLAPHNPLLTTDGIHIDRPFTAAERPALLAYLNTL